MSASIWSVTAAQSVGFADSGEQFGLHRIGAVADVDSGLRQSRLPRRASQRKRQKRYCTVKSGGGGVDLIRVRSNLVGDSNRCNEVRDLVSAPVRWSEQLNMLLLVTSGCEWSEWRAADIAHQWYCDYRLRALNRTVKPAC